MNKADSVILRIRNLASRMTTRDIKRLDLYTFERITVRLDSFSSYCEICNEFLNHLDEYFMSLESKEGMLDKKDLKNHINIRTELTAHLIREHKLVQKGQYMNMFLSIGMIVGAIIGLMVFSNVGVGVPIGLVIGVAVGSLLDADAGKKGRVI
ncbi:MAG: hypothetical protein RBT15_01335 [Gudongella sp.]|nr:hypothetical protein [Gudongella sp.]